MMLRNIVIFGLILITAKGASLGFQLTTNSCQEPVVYNAPGTPIRLRLTHNSRDILAENYSDKDVKALIFGCVEMSGDSLVIKKRIETIAHFDLAHIDLARADWDKSRLSVFGFPTTDESVAECKEIGALFAVIETLFADDSIWKLPETSSEKATTLTIRGSKPTNR